MKKVGSVTKIYTNLIFGMVIPYDITKIFDRRLQQISSAILDFGGHLGFFGHEISDQNLDRHVIPSFL